MSGRLLKRVARFAGHVLYTAWCMGGLWLLHQAVLWIVGLSGPILVIAALVVVGLGKRVVGGTLFLGVLGFVAVPPVVLALGAASISYGLFVLVNPKDVRVARRRERPQVSTGSRPAKDRVAHLIAISFDASDTTRALAVDGRHQAMVHDYLGRGGSIRAPRRSISPAQLRRLERHLSAPTVPRTPPQVVAHVARVVDAHLTPPTPRSAKRITGDQHSKIDKHVSAEPERRLPPPAAVRITRMVDAFHRTPDPLPLRVMTTDQDQRVQRYLGDHAEAPAVPTISADVASAVEAHFCGPADSAPRVISGDQDRRIRTRLAHDLEAPVAPAVTAHAARVVQDHFNPPHPLTVFDRLPSHTRQRYVRTIESSAVVTRSPGS